MQKPVTHDQRLREARGETRATADRLYDRTRRRNDPRLKRAAKIRAHVVAESGSATAPVLRTPPLMLIHRLDDELTSEWLRRGTV